jgi:hypothetical protein
MDKKLFVIILAVYALALVATGYLSFFRFVGLATFPPPDMIAAVKGDPDLSKDMFADVARAREQNTKLVDLAAHSFDVLLGALLGFLSAGAISAGIGKPTTATIASADKSPASSNQDTALR